MNRSLENEHSTMNSGSRSAAKSQGFPRKISSNLFLRVFHVRFLDFDSRFGKFMKFYTKAIFFIIIASQMMTSEQIYALGGDFEVAPPSIHEPVPVL